MKNSSRAFGLSIFLASSMIAINTTSYADSIKIMAYQKVVNQKSNTTTLVPLTNNEVFVSTFTLPNNGTSQETDGFYPTDSQGYFTIPDVPDENNEMAADLASGDTILVDCRSRTIPIQAGFIVLGEQGTSCPEVSN